MRKTAVICLNLCAYVLLLVVGAGCAADERELDRQLELGMYLSNRGECESAIKQFKTLEGRSDFHWNLAQEHMARCRDRSSYRIPDKVQNP